MVESHEHINRTVYIKVTRRNETTHHKKQVWIAIGHVCIVCQVFITNGDYVGSPGQLWDIKRGTR